MPEECDEIIKIKTFPRERERGREREGERERERARKREREMDKKKHEESKLSFSEMLRESVCPFKLHLSSNV